MKKYDPTKWFFLVLIILSIILVLVERANSADTDLTEFLVNVAINAPTDDQGHYLINPNNPYDIKYEFRENEDRQFDNSSMLYYDFPEGITVSDFGQTFFEITVDDDQGTAVIQNDKFTVVDNQLRVWFNQSDPNFSRLAAAANVRFEISISSRLEQQEVEIVFNSFIVKDFTYQETHDLHVTKKATYNQDSDTAFYEVNIKSEGTNTGIVIEDKITGTALTFNRDVTSLSSVHGPFIPAVDYDTVSNGFRMTISEMRNDETVTIRYSASVDNNKITGKGTVAETKNTVKAVSVEVPNGKEAEANIAGLIDIYKIKKVTTEDPVPLGDNKYEITWDITVNLDHKQIIGGNQVSDTLDTFMWFTGEGITIDVTFENGDTEQRIVPWSDLLTYVNDFGIYGWVYSAPESDGKAAYAITCRSIVDTSVAYGPLTVVNKAAFLNNSTTASQSFDNPGNGEIIVQKSALYDSASESQWKITVSIPGEGLPDFKIVDDLPWLSYDGQYLIDQIIPESLEVSGLTNDETYQYQINSTGITFTLSFYKDSNLQNSGLNPTSDGSPREITVVYKTRVNQEWLDLAEDSEYKYYTVHTNRVSARVFNYRVPANAIVIPVRQTITKEFINYRYEVIDGLSFPVFKYCITLLGPVTNSTTIDDRFDTSYFKFYTGDGIQIAGGMSYNPTDTDGTVSVMDTAEGIRFFVESFPTASDGSLYKIYKINYSLVVKDAESLRRLNQNTAETGELSFANIATWNGISSEEINAVYTYYPYVDKGIVTFPHTGNSYIAEFKIIVNKYEEDLDPAADYLVVQDHLDYSLRFIPDSLEIIPSNENIAVQHDVDTNTLTFTNIPDGTRFEIIYRARVLGTGPTTYSNTVKLGRFEKHIEETVIITSSGGGSASNPSITLIKRDSSDLSVTLEGAEFQLRHVNNGELIPVINSDGQIVSFTTNADGTALISGNMQTMGWTLWEDRMYCLSETRAPIGYKLTNTPYCFTLTRNPSTQVEYYITGDQFNIQNDPETICIPVTKSWIGPAADQATIHLYAGDTDTGKQLILSGINQWHGEFAGLRKYDLDGTLIKYSIREEINDIYIPEYKENADGSIEIINRNHEMIEIPVEKRWNGPEQSSVTVDLYRDGILINSVELAASNEWKHVFVRLPRFDEAVGHEFEYFVREKPISGYEPEYSGNAQTGFVITNKYVITPTTTSAVTPTATLTPDPTATPTNLPTITPTKEPTVISTETATWIPTATETWAPTATSTPLPTRHPCCDDDDELPRTGFNRKASKELKVNAATVKYRPLRMELQIPELKLTSEIVLVEKVNGSYPVEDLGNRAGLLADSARPGEGISVIAAHNTLNEQEYGPFALILLLSPGDRFFVKNSAGDLVMYEVYDNIKINARDFDLLYETASKYESTLTLLTCEDELIEGGYESRRIVSAKQIQ